MAITYRAGATANNGQTANTNTATVTVPGTAVAGDVALFCMVQNSGSATFTAPAGWTPLRPAGPDTINSNLRTQVWIKTLVSGDIGASASFTSNVGARLIGVLSVYAGATATGATIEMNPVPVADSTPPYSIAAPSIDTSVDGSAIHGFWVLRDPTGVPSPDLTVPATHTARSVAKTAFAASPNYTIQASHRTTFGPAGTYGTTPGEASEPSTAIVYYVALPPTPTTPPVASFTPSATSGTAPLSVTFTDTSTNSPTAWAWDFGDGSTSTAQSPTHSYASAGTYTVTLTATNAGGSDVSSTATIVVSGTTSGGGLHRYRLQGGAFVPLAAYTLVP